MKAKAIVERAQMIDSKMNVKYLVDEAVECVHQQIFNNHCKSADFICNTLSGEGHHIVHDQAVLFHKPMVDCGVEDGLGHTSVIVPLITDPHFTKEFKKAPPPSKWFFPSTIEPCVTFACDGLFEPYYSAGPREVQHYATNKEYLRTLLETSPEITLKRLKELILNQPKDFEDCIRWARKLFHKRFYRNIMQLLYTFPLDYVDSHGKSFWKGHRKPPTPITFNANDALHMSFIETAAVLRAEMYGISTDECKSHISTSLTTNYCW